MILKLLYLKSLPERQLRDCKREKKGIQKYYISEVLTRTLKSEVFPIRNLPIVQSFHLIQLKWINIRFIMLPKHCRKQQRLW